jgi:hypothetical protein
MAHPMGEREAGVLRLYFDRRLMFEFHGSKFTSDCLTLAKASLVLPGESRVTFDNVTLSGGPYDQTGTTKIHG